MGDVKGLEDALVQPAFGARIHGCSVGRKRRGWTCLGLKDVRPTCHVPSEMTHFAHFDYTTDSAISDESAV
jgi:hypothetical protein